VNHLSGVKKRTPHVCGGVNRRRRINGGVRLTVGGIQGGKNTKKRERPRKGSGVTRSNSYFASIGSFRRGYVIEGKERHEKGK